MAASQLTGAPERAVITTPAMSADVARAVTRYEIAAAQYAELTAMDARDMTGAQFDSLALAEDTMSEARRLLAQAGQLHLIDRTANDRRAHDLASYVRPTVKAAA